MFIGKVCVGSVGRVGLVVRKTNVVFSDGSTHGEIWEGIGLDGKGLWCSRQPVVLCDSIEEYMNRLGTALKQPGCVYPPLGSGGLNPIGASVAGRQMKAALDLLAACKAAVGMFDLKRDSVLPNDIKAQYQALFRRHPTCKMLVAAIAKAEGASDAKEETGTPA